MFLSVDVVGSTAFKNRKTRRVQAWLPFFADFYRDFPVSLAAQLKGSRVEIPELWKSLGDELLFYCELKNHRDARVLLEAFVKCLGAYRKRIHTKKLDAKLDLKGSAWTAGFPVVNAILQSPRKPVDFIGPCIDIGFRLGKLASPDRVYVSVELAYLLTFENSELFHLRFESTAEFKGVLENKPYPLICLEFKGEVPKKNESLESRLRSPTDPIFLKEYIKAFIADSRLLILPFIDGDKELSERPAGFAKKLEEVRRLHGDVGTTEPEASGKPKTDKPLRNANRMLRDLQQLLHKGVPAAR